MQSGKEKYSELCLGIVCPMANEKDTVASFVKEVLFVCRAFHFESIRFYVIIDLASKDGTRDILQQMSKETPPLKVIYSPENKNVVDAYKRGYQEAIADGVDWILEIDAGFSHRPSDIPQFFETMISGNYDAVFGSRFCRGGRIDNCSLRRFVFSFGGTWLVNALLGTKLKDMTSGFELFKREALCAILNKGVMSQGPFFQTEIRTFAHQFKITEVPIIFNSATSCFHRNALEDSFKNLRRLYQMKLNREYKING